MYEPVHVNPACRPIWLRHEDSLGLWHKCHRQGCSAEARRIFVRYHVISSQQAFAHLREFGFKDSLCRGHFVLIIFCSIFIDPPARLPFHVREDLVRIKERGVACGTSVACQVTALDEQAQYGVRRRNPALMFFALSNDDGLLAFNGAPASRNPFALKPRTARSFPRLSAASTCRDRR